MTDASTANTDDLKIRIGVSSCLLGEQVRFDGGHKHSRYITDVLGDYMEFVGVCPEVECGLSVPRESMRLMGDPDRPRLIGPKSGTDYTEQMQTWAADRVAKLADEDLHGFIFKAKSPSSGAFRVKVYNEHGMATNSGRGLFAGAFMDSYPWLPVEEEGRLNDLPLRENFMDRVFAYARFRQAMTADPTPKGLVAFHTTMKLTVMAHSPAHYKSLGQLVADAGKTPWETLHDLYRLELMIGLKELASKGRHTNVLQHIQGFLKDQLSGKDKAELQQVFEDYRQGLLPLIVPITLLKHHLNRHDAPDWLEKQAYLHPYPKELMLRNHV